MKLKHNLFTFIALAICSLTAQANEQYYQVDLVMFTRAPAPRTGTELFNRELKPIDTSTAIDLNMSTDAKFQPLDPSLSTVANAANKLTDSGKFRLLAFYSWVQPGLPQHSAIPIKVQAGNFLDPALFEPAPQGIAPIQINESTDISEIPAFDDYAAQNTIEEELLLSQGQTIDQQVAVEQNELIPDPLSITGPTLENWHPEFEVEGTITIIRERYLHFLTDLNVTLNASQDPMQNNLLTSHLKTHRKMRSKEFHYVDHPLVGFILNITPVDTPSIAIPAASTTTEQEILEIEDIE